MNDILVGGLSRDMAATIEQRLDGVSVHLADTGGQVLEWLASRNCELLVLDHGLPGVEASDIVRRLTEGSASSRIPVLYCLSGEDERAGARASVERFGVRSFLMHPFGSDQLVETIATLVAAASSAASAGAPIERDGQAVPAVAAQATPAIGPAIERRIEHLDRTAVALIEGAADGAAIEAAHRDTGQLAGLMVAFGRHQGAALAREIEHLTSSTPVRPGSRSIRSG